MTVRLCRVRRNGLLIILLLATGCDRENVRQPWTEDLLPGGAVRITNQEAGPLASSPAAATGKGSTMC
jgi:hypothetical protein